MPQRILIIDDEVSLLETLKERLERDGFEVLTALNGEEGLKMALNTPPDLMLVDMIMPKMGGMDLCRNLRAREEGRKLPIIMMTGKGEDIDEILALELGADDYLTKPFDLRQLIARIRALLRRTSLFPSATAGKGESLCPILVDKDLYRVSVRGQNISLTNSQFQILATLTASPGKIFSRSDLLHAITKEEGTLVERNIDVHIGIIRRKLGKDGKLIETVRTVGYRFLLLPDTSSSKKTA